MIKKEIKVRSVDSDAQFTLSFQEIDECPVCHFALRPEIKHGYYIQDKTASSYTAYLACLCPKCREMFFIKYSGSCAGTIGNPHLQKMIPVTPHMETFSEGISDLSPTFVNTYNQAQFAEDQGLTEICGIGYRRALEFLVKDYLIHLSPDQENVIKAERLSNSINRIEYDRIKTLAQRSTWIGNDETHYVRKHEDYDYSDMKRFIISMVRYIDSELTFEEALTISPK